MNYFRFTIHIVKTIIRFSLSLLLCISLISDAAKAQNRDSLYSVWQNKSLPDTSRIKAIDHLARVSSSSIGPDTGFYYAQLQYDFAKETNNKLYMAKALKTQGLSFYFKSSYPEALEYLQKSLEQFEEIEDLAGIAGCCSNIGLVYGRMENYTKALEFHLRCMGIHEDIGDKVNFADDLSNIGSTYESQGDYPKALNYLSRSFEVCEQTGNKEGAAIAAGNIGVVYLDKGNYEKALKYFKTSLKLSEELGLKHFVDANLNNIGLIYMDQGNSEKSLEYLEKNIESAIRDNDKRGIAGGYINIGNVYYNEKNYPKAMEFLQKGLKVCEEIGHKTFMSNALQSIGSVFRDKGEFSEAQKFYERALEIKKETKDDYGVASVYNSLGDLAIKNEDYRKAQGYCLDGFELGQEIGSLSLQKGSCLCLYNSYKELGNCAKSLEYFEYLSAIEDSLNSEGMGKKLQQMEFDRVMLKDSLSKAEESRLVTLAHEKEVREKNKTRNILAGGGAFILIVALGIYGRLRYTTKAKKSIEKEKDRSENLLLNILPAEIAEELKLYGKADAKDFDLVSILFTDFKGFTSASEKMSAKDLVSEINTCFEAFDGIVTKYQVEKIKTIGDAYMAAGGLPIPAENSVKNTVLAALEMQDFIVKRSRSQKEKNLPFFEMRVGIHTGHVIAGIVGVKKFQYDLWGDTVNTASRMESSGEVGKVNISQSTYELLKNRSVREPNEPELNFESRGKIEVKGKGAIEMWFVSLNNI